jgi:hypothetical protein
MLLKIRHLHTAEPEHLNPECNPLQIEAAGSASQDESGRIRLKGIAFLGRAFRGQLDSVSIRCLSNYFTFSQSGNGA